MHKSMLRKIYLAYLFCNRGYNFIFNNTGFRPVYFQVFYPGEMPEKSAYPKTHLFGYYTSMLLTWYILQPKLD